MDTKKNIFLILEVKFWLLLRRKIFNGKKFTTQNEKID